jgi:hypothetical protein
MDMGWCKDDIDGKENIQLVVYFLHKTKTWKWLSLSHHCSASFMLSSPANKHSPARWPVVAPPRRSIKTPANQNLFTSLTILFFLELKYEPGFRRKTTDTSRSKQQHLKQNKTYLCFASTLAVLNSVQNWIPKHLELESATAMSSLKLQASDSFSFVTWFACSFLSSRDSNQLLLLTLTNSAPISNWLRIGDWITVTISYDWWTRMMKNGNGIAWVETATSMLMKALLNFGFGGKLVVDWEIVVVCGGLWSFLCGG